jgi:hypothetical protein
VVQAQPLGWFVSETRSIAELARHVELGELREVLREGRAVKYTLRDALLHPPTGEASRCGLVAAWVARHEGDGQGVTISVDLYLGPW